MDAGAAHAAAIANAVKASGAIVRMEPNDFLQIVYRADDPLVVFATSKVFKTTFKYLLAYKGLAFFTKSERPLQLGSGVELVAAKQIWIPG